MAQRRQMLLIAVVAAVAAMGHFRQPSFVAPPMRRAASMAVPAAAAVAASTPAFADDIGEAAVKLADAAYPFMKEVDWYSNLALVKPGTASASEWVKAVDKIIAMGAAMDPTRVQEGIIAHHNAIGRINEQGVLPKDNFVQVNAAIGRMIASVPEKTTMGVYNAVAGLVSKDVPPYLMSKVNEEDAKKAYAELMKFKDVVKSHPIKAEYFNTRQPLLEKLGPVEEGAKKLATAAYPLIKDVDWNSEIALKPLPNAEPKQVLKAIDKMLLMGYGMDGKLLKEAAEAHNKAIGSIDAKGVTSAADFEAITVALGKAISSVPTSKVMDVYNAFAKVVDPTVPSYLYSTVNPKDAQAAYAALLEFKDVVKAVQSVETYSSR